MATGKKLDLAGSECDLTGTEDVGSRSTFRRLEDRCHRMNEFEDQSNTLPVTFDLQFRAVHD
jgi:hypothetical protein